MRNANSNYIEISFLTHWQKFKSLTVHSVGEVVGKRVLLNITSGNTKSFNFYERGFGNI